ncbi:MAG: VOC family protein [Pseudomonadota bacterium]
MQLRHLHLHVVDIETLAEWYRTHLGFKTVHQVAGHLIILSHADSECMIGFESGVPLEPASSVHMIFRVGNVDETYQRLITDNVPCSMPPTGQPYGHRVMVTSDPAGHTIELYTPLDGDRPWD